MPSATWQLLERQAMPELLAMRFSLLGFALGAGGRRILTNAG
jgi:hypothetical protein